MESRKQAIIDALRRWIRQRPGLEYGNYGDPTSYRAECRSIARDKREAETLLSAVSWRDGIDADALIRAAEGAYSGRLSIKLDGPWFVDYADGSVYSATSEQDARDHWSRCAGRNERGDGTLRQKPVAAIDYCTGQYWPTEYRRAVCAVLASALRDYQRANMPPITGYRVESWSRLGLGRTRHQLQPTREAAETDLRQHGGSDYGSVSEVYSGNLSAGDWLRAYFLREFGRGIASRWFR